MTTKHPNVAMEEYNDSHNMTDDFSSDLDQSFRCEDLENLNDSSEEIKETIQIV